MRYGVGQARARLFIHADTVAQVGLIPAWFETRHGGHAACVATP
ncbi:hypothetical protein [Rudaea sp.]